MRLFFLIFIFCIYVLSAQSQNIIPDPSVEDIPADCPTGGSLEHLAHWTIPEGGGSVDYFNECYNTWKANVGVPESSFGWESAHSGQGYIGFGTWQEGLENVNELIRVQLLEPLIPGVEYTLTCFLSLAEISAASTDELHFDFSIDNYDIWDNYENDILDEIEITFSSLSSVSMDGWHQLQHTFVATNPCQFLTIGDFRADSLIDTTWIGQTNPDANFSYYFIDDITLDKNDTYITRIPGEKQIVEFFPNPATNYLNIEISSPPGIITITDLSSRILIHENLSGVNHTLDISEQAKGLYFVEIIDNQDIKYGGRLLIK